jgi:hypothetical protein
MEPLKCLVHMHLTLHWMRCTVTTRPSTYKAGSNGVGTGHPSAATNRAWSVLHPVADVEACVALTTTYRSGRAKLPSLEPAGSVLLGRYRLALEPAAYNDVA